LSVNDGYYIELEFEGLGYRFINLSDDLILRVGYSHYVYFNIPVNILVFGFRKKLVLFSLSKEHLNQLLFLLSTLKKYNCYKKKGVFVKGKVFNMKESKSSAK
jgi:large subunit ribosomal protein L6